jgi:hypothetical protein
MYQPWSGSSALVVLSLSGWREVTVNPLKSCTNFLTQKKVNEAKQITQDCTTASEEQKEFYCQWMLKLKDWTIINTETGEKVCKGELFSSMIHDHKEVLKLFTRPVTEEGDILVDGYKLVKRDMPDTKQSEDEAINEWTADAIRMEGVRFLMRQKLSIKKNVHQFNYDTLLDLLTKFGKEGVFDRYEKINTVVEKKFV